MNDKAIKEGRPRTARIAIIFASVFLSLVLLFGAVIGTVTIVRNSRAVVKYGGLLIDEGVASYLAATHKRAFMTSLGEAYDTEDFWSRPYDKGRGTNGEALIRSTEEYIRGIAVGAYLFDRYTSLGGAERDKLDRATREILEFKADGDEKRFNELSAPMGFDYDDFCTATELIYKAAQAKLVIYGEEGAALKSSSMLSECERYYGEYKRVKILYIPTKEDILRDSEGELELDSEGRYVTDYFTLEEQLSRLADITRIRKLIKGYEEDLDEQISPEFFDSMQEKYNYSSYYNKSGYYFAHGSEYTARFAEESSRLLPDGYREAFHKCMEAVIYNAFNMSEGQYVEIEGDYGVCFVYCDDRAAGAYMSPDYDDFFHDFYSDGADHLFADSVEKLAGDVVLKDGYYAIDPITIPYNYLFVATVE